MLESNTEDVEGAVPFLSLLLKLSQYTLSLLWSNLACLRPGQSIPYCLAITGGGSHRSSVVNFNLSLWDEPTTVFALLIVGLSVGAFVVSSRHLLEEEEDIGMARETCCGGRLGDASYKP